MFETMECEIDHCIAQAMGTLMSSHLAGSVSFYV